VKRAAAAALFATGCGFYIVDDRQRHNECTAATPALDYIAPALDVAGAAAVTAAAVIAANGTVLRESSSSCNPSQGNGGTAICPHTVVLAVVVAAAYAVSAIYGFSELHACRSRPAQP
jgi:hypothetical protein